MDKFRLFALAGLIIVGILLTRSGEANPGETYYSDAVPGTIEKPDERVPDLVNLVYKYLFRLEPLLLEKEALEKDLELLNKELAAGDLGVDKSTLFLCRAEIMYRLGRPRQAALNFYQFRYNTASQDHPCLSLAESRLTATLMEMRENITLLDQDQITRDIFNIVFQERKNPDAFDESRMSYLVKVLDILERTSIQKEDKLTLLFLKAEGLYRMNEYKRAYVAFYRLMPQMESCSHPLFSEVENRLKLISRKLKPLKKQLVYTARPVHGVLLAGGLFLLLAFLVKRDYAKSGRKCYGCDIVDKTHLISLDEMREQDGRCSARTMKEYLSLKEAYLLSRKAEFLEARKEAFFETPKDEFWETTKHECWETTKDKFWKNFSRMQQEKYKFAHLLAEGHDMICLMNSKPPLAISWQSEICFIKWIPTYFQYSAAAVVFIVTWWLTATLLPGWCESKDFFYTLFALHLYRCRPFQHQNHVPKDDQCP
nr:hypothetical protein [uncultured Desulfobacter sp.]